jgi:hypothetical protein
MFCRSDVKTAETCASAAAKLRPTTRTRHMYIAARVKLAAVQLKLVIFTLLRCKSTELFISSWAFVSGRAASGPRRDCAPQANAA